MAHYSSQLSWKRADGISFAPSPSSSECNDRFMHHHDHCRGVGRRRLEFHSHYNNAGTRRLSFLNLIRCRRKVNFYFATGLHSAVVECSRSGSQTAISSPFHAEPTLAVAASSLLARPLFCELCVFHRSFLFSSTTPPLVYNYKI